MRSISRSSLIFGLCALPVASIWAADDLDVTIRVIDRHEARMEGFNRIELPREFAAPAVTQVRAERPAESRQADVNRREFKDRSESERRQFTEKKEAVRESTREAMMEARERVREWKETRELRNQAFRDVSNRGTHRP